MSKAVTKYSRKINVEHSRFGVLYNDYAYFDCVDLYIELLLLLNCEIIDVCRTCQSLIKWVTDLLVEKWDTLRFIKLDATLYIDRSLKDLIKSSAFVSFYNVNSCLYLIMLPLLLKRARIVQKHF